MSPPAPEVRPPSGQQYEIGHGLQHAVVTEVGATLRSYTVAGDDVVDGFGPRDICSSGRGQVLAPWPNRLDGGRYSIDGRNGHAALDEPERNCAIHGLVRWLSWYVVSRAQNVLTLGCDLNPQPGYPWRVSISVEYRLGRSGLTVSTEVVNLDEHPAPLGIGFHPYLTVGTPEIGASRLTLPATRRLVADERGIPEGETVVTGTEFDFAEGRLIGDTTLDTAYTGLMYVDGRAEVELDDTVSRSVSVWMDTGFRYVMLYTADGVEPGSRRRKALAIEPMSCPPNALRSGVDLVRLEPGSIWRATWGISPGPVVAEK